jgi:peptide deformylase
MAVYKVLKYPHVLLRKKSTPVGTITPDLAEFSKNMVETMYAYEGIGLAAPQVGILKRFIVVDVKSYLKNPDMKDWHGNIKYQVNGKDLDLPFPLTLVNPEIVDTKGSVEFPFDGCLSFPGVSRGGTARHVFVAVTAKLPTGEDVRVECDGILSICLQHEMDHLEGVLFIDRLDKTPNDDGILQDIEDETESTETRKRFRKLKLLDARSKSYSFL